MLINRGAGSLHRCLTYGVADAIKEPFTILGLVVAMAGCGKRGALEAPPQESALAQPHQIV